MVQHRNEKPKHLDIAQFISESWHQRVTQATILNTWRHIGIVHRELPIPENGDEDNVVLSDVESEGDLFEEVDLGQAFRVVIDYAPGPESLRQL